MAAPQQSIPTSPLMAQPMFLVDASGNPITNTNGQVVTISGTPTVNISQFAGVGVQVMTADNVGGSNFPEFGMGVYNGTTVDRLYGDNTGAARVSLYGKNSVAGDTAVKVDSAGRVTSIIQVTGGTSLATGSNALPILSSTAQGQVALYGSNPSTTGTNADISIKWGAGGTTQVNHVLISNNTSSNVVYEIDAATNAGSDILTPGQKVFLDVQTLIVHLQCASSVNVNGSTAANVVVRGWL